MTETHYTQRRWGESESELFGKGQRKVWIFMKATKGEICEESSVK